MGPPKARPINTHPMQMRSKDGIFKPTSKFSLTVSLTNTVELEIVKQPFNDPWWIGAMGNEHDALIINHTWDLVPTEEVPNNVGCHWVFRTKYLPDGSMDKFKERLVVKTLHQGPRIDFFETFSPMAKPTTIHILLGVATSEDWVIGQLDVNIGFS